MGEVESSAIIARKGSNEFAVSLIGDEAREAMTRRVYSASGTASRSTKSVQARSLRGSFSASLAKIPRLRDFGDIRGPTARRP